MPRQVDGRADAAVREYKDTATFSMKGKDHIVESEILADRRVITRRQVGLFEWPLRGSNLGASTVRSWSVEPRNARYRAAGAAVQIGEFNTIGFDRIHQPLVATPSGRSNVHKAVSQSEECGLSLPTLRRRGAPAGQTYRNSGTAAAMTATAMRLGRGFAKMQAISSAVQVTATMPGIHG
jgi:hypothetical protein